MPIYQVTNTDGEYVYVDANDEDWACFKARSLFLAIGTFRSTIPAICEEIETSGKVSKV